MAVVGALPGTLYLINGLFIQGGLGSQFSGRFVPALLLNPFHYMQWMTKVDLAAGGFFVMLALLGFFLSDDRRFRSLMFGLWGAYLLYSLFFDYHAATHDYYQLPFIPIVAVSLAPLGEWFFARLAGGTVRGGWRIAASVILLLGLVMITWNIRSQMKAADYRSEAAMWTKIGELTRDESVIGLVQDYGAPLEYWGWRTIPTWPYSGDLKFMLGEGVPTKKIFQDYSSRKDLFLVTDFEELRRQPELKTMLDKYPILMQGDGFVIYDLRALD
jgi:hypothetical protein